MLLRTRTVSALDRPLHSPIHIHQLNLHLRVRFTSIYLFPVFLSVTKQLPSEVGFVLECLVRTSDIAESVDLFTGGSFRPSVG
jgi:hypothetical protein